MVTTDDIVAALEAVEILEWGRFSVGVDPVDGLVRPPMLVWRFVDASDDAAVSIERAVDALGGAISWHFDASSKNWTLMPEALRRSFAKHVDDAYTGVLTDFKRANQPLCERATRELGRFVEELLHSQAG